MPAPTFARFYRAPRGWYADDNPWVARFGAPHNSSARCGCCGAGLVARAIVDTSGAVWGVDCFRRVTGQTPAAVRVKVRGPVLITISRRGYKVWANGAQHLLCVIPPDLYRALPASDQRRVDRTGGAKPRTTH